MSRIKWLRFAWNRIMNIQLNWFIPKKVRHAFVKWHVSNIFIKTTRSVFSSRGHATDKLSAGFFVTPTRLYITNEWFYSYVNAAQALSTSATWITCFCLLSHEQHYCSLRRDNELLWLDHPSQLRLSKYFCLVPLGEQINIVVTSSVH